MLAAGFLGGATEGKFVSRTLTGQFGTRSGAYGKLHGGPTASGCVVLDFGLQGSSGPGEPRYYEISRLPSLALRTPLRATLQFLDGEWLAKAVDLPLYGSGDTPEEAREMLARDIESLWDELHEPGAMSPAWATVLRFLERVIHP